MSSVLTGAFLSTGFGVWTVFDGIHKVGRLPGIRCRFSPILPVDSEDTS